MKHIFPFHKVTEEKMPAQVNGNRFMSTGLFYLSYLVSNFRALPQSF